MADFELVAINAAERRIAEIVAPAVEHMGFELVRIRLMSGGTTRLQVMADRPNGGIDVNDCVRISNALSTLLDVEDPVVGEYTLEVSSPGIDRPLTRLRDFDTWAGYDAKIETTELIDGQRRFRGVLRGVQGNEILFEIRQGTIGLDFNLVARASLRQGDDSIRKALKPGETGLRASRGRSGEIQDGGNADDRKKEK